MKEVERIAGTNLMPSYLKRKQFIADSTRAYFYFNLRKDSSYIRKYLRGYTHMERKAVKTMHPEKKEKSPEQPVNNMAGKHIQKITGSFAYAMSGKKTIRVEKPVRKEEALYINDDEYLKNQEIR